MSPIHSPTVRRRRLAVELRRLREEAGLTQDEVAERLDWHPSKLFRMENGRSATQPTDIRAMADLYGVEDERRDALVQLARESRRKGWWHQFDELLTGPYVGLEAEARSLSSYHNEIVDGLLQTAGYARALMAAAPRVQPDELERRLQVRMARQEVLTQEQPLQLWVVLNEAVLRRPVGGPDVMREQVEHLARMAERPNVTLQVLPFALGAHASMGDKFTILEFPERTDPDVVYLEHQANNLYLESRDDVQRYILTFHHLQASGLSPEKTLALIRQVATEL